MQQYSRYSVALAICLSALAGYIDAIGFLELGGYFVSFMSGNSTRLAVSLMTGDWPHAILIGMIITFFVIGSILGTLVGHLAGEKRQSSAVLFFVTIALMIAALCYERGASFPAILFTTLAMGAENTIFQRNGDIVIGLTYMTGTLVKLGQRIAQVIMGSDRFAWLPYLLLWLGLVCGGATGVIAFHFLGLRGLWIAVIWAATLTLLISRYDIAPKPPK